MGCGAASARHSTVVGMSIDMEDSTPFMPWLRRNLGGGVGRSLLGRARSLCSTGEGQSRAANAALTGLAERPSVWGEHADEASGEAGGGVVHDSVPGCELLRGRARRMEAKWAGVGGGARGTVYLLPKDYTHCR